MKQTRLLLCLSLLSSLGEVNGQTRTVDLKAVLVSPPNNATLVVGEPFAFDCRLVNLGPDVIMPGDTVAYSFTGDPNVYGTVVNEELYVNDAVQLNANFSFNQSSAPFDFCVEGMVLNGTSVKDNNPSNNKACHSITVIEGTSEVGELFSVENLSNVQLMLYPNPAKGLVSLDYKAGTNGDIKLVFVDVTGKKVLEHDIYKESTMADLTVDISTLSAGMYIVELHDANVKGVGRLMVE